MTDYRIVIDQSTSATKALLFDNSDELKIVDRVDKPHQQIYPEPGFVEHDATEIIENTKTVISNLLSKNKLLPEVITSISITNQRESIVFWDEITGETYGNVMVWQCNRGINICQELIDEGLESQVNEKTGLKLDPYFSGSKVKWFFDNNEFTPEQWSTLKIGTIDTWLVWNLTNRKKYVTDPSNACRTLLYNIHTQEWDEELCILFGIHKDILPNVIESDGDFGSYLGIPIKSVLADSQAALYGNACIEPGSIKATLGTGSSLLLNIGSIDSSTSTNLLTTIAWRKNDETVYAMEGIIKSYGDILNWVRDQLGLFETYEEGMNLAFQLQNNENVYFVPALEGLSAPFWKPQVHASYHGMTRKTNFIHLIRAAMESMCFQTRAMVDTFKNDANFEISEIFMDGGSVKNELFMQFLADITKVNIKVGNFEELSALGALLIGDTSIQYKPQIKKVYSPMNDYDQEYSTWLKYVEEA